jgi:F0F1-type ATP synthase assembly protein I
MGRIHARVTIFGVVAAQIVAGLVFAGFLAAGDALSSAHSALVGVLAGAVPNYFFALRLFSLPGDADASRQLRAIYVGETLKIAFASAILASGIAFLDVSIGYLLAGFLVTVLVSWCAFVMPLAGEPRR